MNDELSTLTARAVELLRATVADPRFPSRASPVSAYMTALRPYVEAALLGVTPRPLAAATDGRKRPWRVSMEFWKREGDVDTLMGVSPNRVTDSRGEILELGGDVVNGMTGIAQLIADYAVGIGAATPCFQAPALERALGDLRATISRQGGFATMRRTSDDGLWRLVCDVKREEG
jgi:hypothetical protein